MSLIDRIKSAAKANDYAIGLPEKGEYLPFPTVEKPVGTGFVVHHHDAEVAGKHYDLRIQHPDTEVGASWAIPKAKLPGPGEKVLAVRQGDHRTSYFSFQGHIPEGYGKGQVSIAHKGPVEIIEARPDMVRFGLYQTRTPQEYLLRQTKGNSWLLMNTTPQREKIKIPEGKYPYREIKPEKHRVDDTDAVHEAKIDGAHTFMVLNKGQRPRIFSYRRPKSGDTGLIEHSQKLVHWNQKSPENAGKTVLRGETWGKQKGKNAPLRPETIGGLLNANVWKSRQNQDQVGKLKFSPFDVDVYQGKDVRTLPIERRKEIVESIARQMKLELPASAKTPKAKQKLWETIRAGKHPQTREGVIQWRDYPTKIKLRTDYDGKITGFFPAEEGSKYHGNAVGGFYLSHDGATSRVGTGLSDRLRKEMHEHPDRFVGLTATVGAQEKLRSGKLRAPSFMRFHIDKNVPEQLDKIQSMKKSAGPMLDMLKANKALVATIAGGALSPIASWALRPKAPLSPDQIHTMRRVFQKKYDLGKNFKLDVADGHSPHFDPRTNTVRVPTDVTSVELAHELGHAADYAAGDKSLIARLNRGAIEQSYLMSNLAPYVGSLVGMGTAYSAGKPVIDSGSRMSGAFGLIPQTGRLLEELRAHVRGLKNLREQGVKPSAREYLSALGGFASYAFPVATSAVLAARGIKIGHNKTAAVSDIIAALLMSGASMLPVSQVGSPMELAQTGTQAVMEDVARRKRRSSDIVAGAEQSRKPTALPPPNPVKAKGSVIPVAKTPATGVVSLPKHTWGKRISHFEAPGFKDKFWNFLSRMVGGQPHQAFDVTGQFFKKQRGRMQTQYSRKPPTVMRGAKLGNHKDQLPGGLADKKKPEDFDKKQLGKGTKVELEHVNNRSLAREIAMDHLVEDPKYYDKLEKIEKHSSLFDRIKLAADKLAKPRWAKMMAAGKLSPEDINKLMQLKDLGIRQIGKAPIGGGAEKAVYDAFGGNNLGRVVSKRTMRELRPGGADDYYQVAKDTPEMFLSPIKKTNVGWIEPRVGPMSQGLDFDVTERGLRLLGDAGEKFEAAKRRANATDLGKVRYAEGYGENPAVALPGGKTLYDLHAGNYGVTPEGDIKLVDAIVHKPGDQRKPYGETVAHPTVGSKTLRKHDAMVSLAKKIDEGKVKGSKPYFQFKMKGEGKLQSPRANLAAKKPAVRPKGPPIRRKLPGIGTV